MGAFVGIDGEAIEKGFPDDPLGRLIKPKVRIPKKKINKHDWYYPDFSTFILALHKIDAKAAKWLAERALFNENGLIDNNKGGFNRNNLISNWKGSYTVNALLSWAQTPQGHEYWREIDVLMTIKRGENG